MLISHRLPGGSKLLGAVAILILLGCMSIGPLLPLLAISALYWQYYSWAALLALLIALSFLVAPISVWLIVKLTKKIIKR